MTETPRAKPVHAEAVGSGLTSDLGTIGAHPDYWYPAAWSRELKAGRSYTARFAGEPIVLVRPADGPVFALEDRCAHRQVPLSNGVVDGCGIRCCYHGWQGADWNQEVFPPIPIAEAVKKCGESPLSPPANSPVVS